MTGKTFNHVCCVLLLVFVLQIGIHVLACISEIKDFSETFAVKEGSFTNITYLLNVTEGTSSNKITIRFDLCRRNGTTTKCTFTWRAQVYNMSVTNWGSEKQTSCSNERLDLRQSMSTWKLMISQLVDRSLSAMSLYVENITHSDKTVQTIRIIRVEALYPSRITSLTIDAQEAGNTYLIDNCQKVNISCFYDKGNPSETFRLVNQNCNETTDSDGSLTYSLSAQCEDVWPTVRCEGNRSEQIRSVSFIVRCPPQFVDSSVNIVTAPKLENIALGVKAHTTAITECCLTSLSLEKSSGQEVKCTLTGTPPNLVLTLHFNEVRITEGNWTVTLRNDLGSTNTTISIINTTAIQHASTIDGLLIGLTCGALLLAAVVIFAIIRAKTLVKQHKDGFNDGSNALAIELQEDVATMVVNDLYETSGRVSSSVATNVSPLIDDLPLRPPWPRTSLPPPEAPARPTRLRAQNGGSASTADCRTGGAEATDEAIVPGNSGTPPTSGRRNADGLIYGDLDFTDRKVSDVIIGCASGIEYTSINTTAIAPPPRDYKQKYNQKR